MLLNQLEFRNNSKIKLLMSESHLTPLIFVSIFTFFAVMAWLPAKMAFSNPDGNCYAVTEPTIFVSSNDSDGAVNVSGRFRWWLVASSITHGLLAIIFGYWAYLIIDIQYYKKNADKWAAVGFVFGLCFMMLIAPLSVINFLVILVGAYIRKTEAGKACSGDFY